SGERAKALGIWMQLVCPTVGPPVVAPESPDCINEDEVIRRSARKGYYVTCEVRQQLAKSIDRRLNDGQGVGIIIAAKIQRWLQPWSRERDRPARRLSIRHGIVVAMTEDWNLLGIDFDLCCCDVSQRKQVHIRGLNRGEASLEAGTVESRSMIIQVDCELITDYVVAPGGNKNAVGGDSIVPLCRVRIRQRLQHALLAFVTQHRRR